MALLNFTRKAQTGQTVNPVVSDFLRDFSIEVMPRTAAKVEKFQDILP